MPLSIEQVHLQVVGSHVCFGSASFSITVAMRASAPSHWRNSLVNMVNISPMLRLPFWMPVCHQLDDASFPSDSPEGHGHHIRISENCGHKMTCKILTDDTHKVITQLIIHPAHEDAPNLHLDPIGGEKQPPEIPEILKLMHQFEIDAPDDVTNPETSGISGEEGLILAKCQPSTHQI